MKKSIVFVFITMLLVSCSVENPTEFSEKALNDVFTSINDEEVKFKEILEKNKGKKIVIDVWASWCKDCLENLPDVKKQQEENSKVAYLYLSLDRDLDSWKEGVKRLELKGQHYFMKSGWEGSFGKFLALSWIPRYLVIDEEGKIAVFNKTKITDSAIIKELKK